MVTGQLLNKLKEALQALALPYEDQIKSFPNFAVVTDELVLGYDEIFQKINQLDDNGNLSEGQLAALKSIDDYSEYLSKNHKSIFLEPKKLKTDEKWEKMRQLAMSALNVMAWKLERPNFSHSIYIQAD